MKIALYIEDGLEQIALTPQTPNEKSILGKMHDGERDLKIFSGSFYHYQGGWTRQRASDDSTIIMLNPKITGENING